MYGFSSRYLIAQETLFKFQSLQLTLWNRIAIDKMAKIILGKFIIAKCAMLNIRSKEGKVTSI